MGTSPDFSGAYSFVSNIFQIRPEWLVFPEMITVFIIPFIFNIWMIKIMFEDVIKVFPGTGVNWILGGVIGFLLLPFNNLTMWVSPLIIGWFGIQNRAWKIVLIGVLYSINIWILPWVTNFFVTGRF